MGGVISADERGHSEPAHLQAQVLALVLGQQADNDTPVLAGPHQNLHQRPAGWQGRPQLEMDVAAPIEGVFWDLCHKLATRYSFVKLQKPDVAHSDLSRTL